MLKRKDLQRFQYWSNKLNNSHEEMRKISFAFMFKTRINDLIGDKQELREEYLNKRKKLTKKIRKLLTLMKKFDEKELIEDESI